MAVSCAAFGLGSVAVAGCSGDGCSWVGWEGVVAASYRVLPVVICTCFLANMCCRLLEAVEIVVGGGGVRELCCWLRLICS